MFSQSNTGDTRRLFYAVVELLRSVSFGGTVSPDFTTYEITKQRIADWQ